MDPRLSGLLVGCTLHTTRAEIYRALIESTAFGARMIIERIREYGVPIRKIVCAGGIAEKNPLLMQIYADVTGCTLQVAGSSQACALGSAISAAVLAGGHRDFPVGAEGHDAARQRPSTARIRAAAGPTTASTGSTACSTTASAGVRTRADFSRVMKAPSRHPGRQRS